MRTVVTTGRSALVLAATALVVTACQGPTATAPPTTATPTTWPSGQLDCGTRYLASGWPTTTMAAPSAFDCILDAFATGTPARYVEREQTDGSGGHIRITSYEVLEVGSVRRTVDATGAAPPGGITISTCGQISHELGSPVLTAGSCA